MGILTRLIGAGAKAGEKKGAGGLLSRALSETPDAGRGGANNAWREQLRSEGFNVDQPVYHGTRADFENFDLAKVRRGPGIWTTTHPRDALEYSSLRGEGANIRPMYARGPFIDDRRFYSEVSQGGFDGDVAAARAAGFRGVQDGDTIMVFDPGDLRPQFGPTPRAPDGSSL